MKLRSVLPMLLLLTHPLCAHEHWVTVSPGPFDKSKPLTIYIQSGHELGESEFLLDTELIREAFVLSPSGEQTPLNVKVQGNEHIASFTPSESGEHTIQIKLRKRDKGPFSHFLISRFQVDTGDPIHHPENDPELAIILDRSEKHLIVSSKGEPVNVPIQLLRSGSMSNSLLRDKQGFSSLENVEPGMLVAVAHFRRQTVSLSFNLGE